ncbi:MAG TPA: DUF3368 domain-containing protein [Firmicutes bacterium]|nr:DUF3368 domain-containing protein [Bacillota bacterium]
MRQKVYVTDANVWNDLKAADLLKETFELPIQFITPDVILEELLELDGKKVVSLGLVSRGLSGEGVAQVSRLRGERRYRSLSTPDLFALVLTEREGLSLLTGDAKLRKIAEEDGVLVRGTLWLLDELVRLKIISPQRGAEAIEDMLRKDRRLPRLECDRRLQQWRLR